MRFDWLRALNIGGLVILFVYTWAWIVTTALPHTYWFNYDSVTPAQEAFEVGEDLVFNSSGRRGNVSSVEWLDILRCDTDSTKYGYKRIDEMKASAGKRSAGDFSVERVYNGIVPDEPATCYLESNICVPTLIDGNKCQQYIGPTFRIE